MRNIIPALFLGAVAIGTCGTAGAAGNAVRGKALYGQMCAACHSIEYNGIGPAHKGVFGRKAGSASDYAYSPALKSSAIVWNEKTLDKWLAGPEKFIPGQKMGFMVRSRKDRADLIAYLKTTGEQDQETDEGGKSD